MGAFPTGKGVGAKARVNHGNRRFKIGLVHIRIKLLKLSAAQHALVNNCAAGKAGKVEEVAILVFAGGVGIADSDLRPLPDDVEFALKGEFVGFGQSSSIATYK